MTDDFKTVLDTLIKEGFYQLPDADPTSGKPFDYKITPYSLNTKLSFKFENLNHFIAFLQRSDAETAEQQIAVLNATFIEHSLDPDQFFYVNFFEKGKELEM